MEHTEEVKLPRYKCHKEVRALKIIRIIYDDDIAADSNRDSDGSAMLSFDELDIPPTVVDRRWVEKHNPIEGGYWVLYDDNYESFSPAKAFEEGYTRI